MSSHESVVDEIGDAVAAASRRYETIGWIGWIAKGIVYSLLGVLLFRVAVNRSYEEANQAGAVETIAETPFGSALLILIAIGLVVYVGWRLFTVVLPGDWTGRALLDRAGYLVSAVVYVALLFTLVEMVASSSSTTDSEEDRVIESLVVNVLGTPGGQTAVLIAGLAVIAVGIAFVHKGWTRGFMDTMPSVDGTERTIISRLGAVGWIARGISAALIGYFLSRAAWMFDPSEAAGLDDSIRQVSTHTLGSILAIVVAVGFMLYGIFAALSARHRELEGPRNDPS